MIESFYFSIAGKKRNKEIDLIIGDFLDSPFFSSKDKTVLKHTIEVAQEGNYPTKDYYCLFYEYPAYVENSLAEIKSYAKKIKDFYKKEYVAQQAIQAVNTSNSTSQLVDKLSEITSNKEVQQSSDLSRFKVKSYSDYKTEGAVEGYKIGINEVDSLTFGVQPGTLMSICANPGGGKSTALNSAIFKNALLGKKTVLFSIELTPDLVWLMYQARYLYEVKGMEVTTTDLIQHRLTDEKAKLVESYDEDFKKDICQNLLIVDESVLSKKIVGDAERLKLLFEEFQDVLGGLDAVAVDHVHQIELMFPDMGNIFIRNYVSAGKTWLNNKGLHPSLLMAVQVNREGYKKACKRDGVYTLDAIGDLNECASPETSLFVDGKEVTYQFLKRNFKGTEQVSVVDYKSGLVENASIKEVFTTGVVFHGFKWRKLTYQGAPNNMMFTPTHRVLVNGKKVKLEDLPSCFLADFVNAANVLINKGLRVTQEEVEETKVLEEKINFEVAHKDHNYVLPGGLVSANCERASSYVIFLHTTDDSKIVQETKVSMVKNRLGQVLPDPAIVTFNPAVMLVGTNIETISADEDQFSDLMSDFGEDFDTDF